MKGPLRGGMFSRHVKRHPGLIPLIGFISVGLGSAVLYLLRLALYSPDVRWKILLLASARGWGGGWKRGGRELLSPGTPSHGSGGLPTPLPGQDGMCPVWEGSEENWGW
ncbi:uncharacterized protein LOC113962573 isoform X1 [Neopelma chrysocephalum]|uniref:uncharacterized protein LOC113962573 isoform X1 n=1 Tax=Neopelma chrysocephalum TaxID=114329 RepID=UPI000FCD194A|nr:uncharacterized protein LOC113962573 isoform X1 [Neopelma chrysocephalum]